VRAIRPRTRWAAPKITCTSPCRWAVTVAKSLEEVKRSSSKWIKTKGPRYVGFAWQNGYGAFSIGQSQRAALKKYIAGQEEHHRRETFEEECREFLRRYQVAYDERYVWD